MLAASLREDESYKYSDHVVYTDAFQKTVRRLNRAWHLDIGRDCLEFRMLAIELMHIIRMKFGRQYKCSLVLSDDGFRMVIGDDCFDVENDVAEIEKTRDIIFRLFKNNFSVKAVFAKIRDLKIEPGDQWWAIKLNR